VAPERVLFNARRYVPNGTVGNISHVVYVDPDKYAELPDRPTLLAVGRAVGKLNTLLPKRQFILMGPGRWGSRGDIKLGVSVGYSDISNTALLVEIARKKGDYVPDVSFGTHFFQDLVEARIRYLALYPDDESILFNEQFLLESRNVLADVAPEYAHLSDVVRLIDVAASTDGLAVQVLMNGDLDEAVAVLAEPDSALASAPTPVQTTATVPDDCWRWRLEMAEALAAKTDPEHFGVEAIYVFGSTKNATAGPGSDIDLLVHFNGTQQQQTELQRWLDGWSQCLDELNYLRTGHRSRGLLDVHFVTDEDIRKKTSYAVKIGAVTDAARELRMQRSSQ
jgi:predicted nucleotidyltransferase